MISEKTQNLCLLGSTGSIGKQVLELVQHSETRAFTKHKYQKHREYRIINLACQGSDPELIFTQIEKFQPKQFFISQKETAELIKEKVRLKGLETEILTQTGALAKDKDFDYLSQLALDPEVESVLIASTGTVALKACLESIKAGKKIIIANKEILISAGELINQTLARYPQARLIPADSEHVGIHQSLAPNSSIDLVRNLYLTASGGPFWGKKELDLKKVTVAQALRHPTWKMGAKISIDSATMMNKGFEIIEAHYLFQIDYSKIKAIIHPQSLVHSLLEFIDGNILAQLAPNDMRLILQYALDFPDKQENLANRYLDLIKNNKLEFYEASSQEFKCLELAYFAGKAKKSYPAALVIADQLAVDLFLREQILFSEIPEIIDRLLQRHKPILIKEPEDLYEIERATAEYFELVLK